MKAKKIAILLWTIFLFPSLYFFLKSIIENNFNIFQTSNISAQMKTTFSYMTETMHPKIDTFTLEILIINSIVMLCLWLISFLIYIVFYKRKEIKYKPIHVMYVALFCNAFFYLKEGVKMGYTIYEFSKSFGLPYFFSFFTLILPHLIFEFTAFIMASAISLKWLYDKISSKTSKINYKLISFSILVLLIAAIVETTLTPYLFTTYLKTLL